MTKTEREARNHPVTFFIGLYVAWRRNNRVRIKEYLDKLADRGWTVEPPPKQRARRKAGAV